MPARTVQLEERPMPLVHRLKPTELDAVPRPFLHHVQLKTIRMDEMIDWYCQVTGMVVNFEGMGGAWLTNDDANHRLALVTSPHLADEPNKLAHTGMHHTAWEYADIDELLSTYERLRDAGILPHRTVNHGPSISFYYVDPDGNSVELQVDNDNDWRESAKFFESAQFAADPYGPGVDPEKLIAARREGASASEIHRRCYAGEFPNVRENDRRMPV
jgi:catechol 2,3-dioxygenase